MGVLEITVEIAVINIILVIATQLVSLEGLLVVTGSRNSSCALTLSVSLSQNRWLFLHDPTACVQTTIGCRLQK